MTEFLTAGSHQVNLVARYIFMATTCVPAECGYEEVVDNAACSRARIVALQIEFIAEQDAVIAIYDARAGAEGAVKALQHSGIDMGTLSMAKDTHTDEQVVGFYCSDRLRQERQSRI